MKNLDLSRYVLNCAAVALLSGCGGSPSAIGALGAIPQSRAISTHADRGRSWMLPEAKSEDLLYIANHEMLTVYSYPSAKLVGILRPHLNPVPLTECSDKAGDVFVTDLDDVYVWVHGRIKPLRTLTFYGASAVACSSDPTTGNLAVTYQMGSTAYVAVYKKAKGTPTLEVAPVS